MTTAAAHAELRTSNDNTVATARHSAAQHQQRPTTTVAARTELRTSNALAAAHTLDIKRAL